MYLSKCCYFVPLRIGLLSFSAVKILALVIHTSYKVYFNKSDFPPNTEEDERNFMVILIIGTIMKIIQILFTTALIVAILKKNYNIVRVCYAYSAFMLVLEILKCFVYIPLETYRLHAYTHDGVWWSFFELTTTSIITIGLECYFVVLIHSHLCSMKQQCISDPEVSAYTTRKPHIAY